MPVCAAIQRIDKQTRQEKVVDGKAFLRHLLMQSIAVFGVYFGQNNQFMLFRQLFQSLQIIPGAGFIEKIAHAGLFVQISEGIEPHKPGPIITQFL